jgi:hypothetical protein
VAVPGVVPPFVGARVNGIAAFSDNTAVVAVG